MSLQSRRILYIFFVILFLIITPLISLYASGYKLGQGFRFEKTGILILDSEPGNARIYVDDKLQQTFWKKYFDPEESYIRTPAKIKNLLPGEYYIKMEIDGYWPWQKKLEVLPGQSTFAEDVRLFKKEIPTNVNEGNFSEIIEQSNDDYIFLKENDGVQVFDKKHESILFSIEKIKNPQSIEWSVNKKSFIIDDILYFIDNEEGAKISLPIYSDQKIKFSANNSNEIIFYNGNTLSFYNLKTGTITEEFKNSGLTDFFEKDGMIYFVRKGPESADLIVWDKNEKSIKKQIGLPNSDYRFVNIDHPLINLFDEKHNILFLIDPFTQLKPLRDSIANINKFEWIDNETMVFANDYEIWLYQLSDLKKTILTRISDKIDSIMPHPSHNYILFSTDSKINIMELDNREKRNITELISLNTIKNPILTDKGKQIYFLAQIGKLEGLYKLFIQ